MKWLCIWLIRFYRRFISPYKSQPTCRFTPSCSTYGLEAFTTHGFFVGLFLTVRRILRCHPFHPGGYDPVPKKGEVFRSLRRTSTDTQHKRILGRYDRRKVPKDPVSDETSVSEDTEQ